MKISTALIAIFVVMIWGINPTLSKLGVTEMPTFAFLAVRYFLTAVFFLPFARVRQGDWKLLILFAIFLNVMLNGLCYVAYLLLQPATATLFLQLGAPVSILMACLFAREKITIKQILSLLAAFSGVVVILGLPEINILGVVLILVSHVFWGGCQLIFKGHKELQPTAMIAYGALFSLPFMMLISFIWEPHALDSFQRAMTLNFTWLMAFQVFGLSGAMILWQKLVAVHGINKVNPFTMLEIVFSVLAGYIAFSDTLTPRICLGIVLISAGVLFTLQGTKADDSTV